MKQLKAEVLEEAFEHFRRCGAGTDECVVYMTSSVEAPELVDGVIHPSHTASLAGYDLDTNSLGTLWKELAETGRSIQMQVHTHPGAAYHSARDDSLSLIHTTGFLSLVIPRFALGPVGLEDAFLAERDDEGSFVEVTIDTRLEIVP